MVKNVKLCVRCGKRPIAGPAGNTSYCRKCFNRLMNKYQYRRTCRYNGDYKRQNYRHLPAKIRGRIIQHSIRMGLAKRVCRANKVAFDDAPAEWLEKKLKRFGY